jgi:hypothetical protein
MLPAEQNDVRTSVRCRRLKCWLPQGKEFGEHQFEQTWALLQCPIPRKCPTLKAELCLLAGRIIPQVYMARQPCAMDLVSIDSLAHNALIGLSDVLYLIFKFAVALWYGRGGTRPYIRARARSPRHPGRQSSVAFKEAIVQINMNAEFLGLLGQLADQLSIR